MRKQHIPGILNLFWFPPEGFAPSMMEHIQSFSKHSAYGVVQCNTAFFFPKLLENYTFDCVLLHYSLFGGPIHWLDGHWKNYLKSMPDALKVAFFQDEYRFWGLRYELLDELEVDIVYSCFEPQWHDVTYRKHGWEGKVIQALTGYVGDHLFAMADTYAKPLNERSMDVVYRARCLEEYMGHGAMEKHRIGEEFARRCTGTTLQLDISMSEKDRIYGEQWYAFLGNSRACLGVEAGVSAVDTDDVLWPAWRRMKDVNPELTFEEFSEASPLAEYEDGIFLRTLSPRHFEAAAMKTCQILFEGGYSGVLEPWRHYLPLKKDFSNFDEILRALGDVSLCESMVDRARSELIDSGLFHYRRFMRSFDNELMQQGVSPDSSADALREELAHRLAQAQLSAAERVKQGEGWFGPDCFPRPNWPKNLLHLRESPQK